MIVTIEADVGNKAPSLEAGIRALEAREPEAEALLVVRGLDPIRVFRAHEEQGAAGGLRVFVTIAITDIDRPLADIGVELDPDPAKRVRLELRSIALSVVLAVVGEEAKMLHV